MKLIDLLSLLDYNDFVEIMEVNTTSELHCYVKDSYNYLKKFEKEINAYMTVTNYNFIKDINIHRIWVSIHNTFSTKKPPSPFWCGGLIVALQIVKA